MEEHFDSWAKSTYKRYPRKSYTHDTRVRNAASNISVRVSNRGTSFSHPTNTQIIEKVFQRQHPNPPNDLQLTTTQLFIYNKHTQSQSIITPCKILPGTSPNPKNTASVNPSNVGQATALKPLVAWPPSDACIPR